MMIALDKKNSYAKHTNYKSAMFVEHQGEISRGTAMAEGNRLGLFGLELSWLGSAKDKLYDTYYMTVDTKCMTIKQS